MRTLHDYISTAIGLQPRKSGNQLAQALGISGNGIHRYANGMLPSFATMIKLADIIGVSRKVALADLVYWQAQKTSNEEVITMAIEIVDCIEAAPERNGLLLHEVINGNVTPEQAVNI